MEAICQPAAAGGEDGDLWTDRARRGPLRNSMFSLRDASTQNADDAVM